VHAFFPSGDLPEPLRPLRDAARQAIRMILPGLPLALGWLADQAGMGWELVALLGAALALTAWRPRGAAGRAMLAAALGAGCVLALGAGHGVLPQGLATALPFAALILAGMLLDARALAACLAVLLAAAALAQAGGLALALAAAAILLGQRLARHRYARGAVVLAPGARPAAPVFSRPREGLGRPGLLVQAERTPDGAVRLAVAGPAMGRLRVSVR
jgi:hypothetical protein